MYFFNIIILQKYKKKTTWEEGGKKNISFWLTSWYCVESDARNVTSNRADTEFNALNYFSGTSRKAWFSRDGNWKCKPVARAFASLSR